MERVASLTQFTVDRDTIFRPARIDGFEPRRFMSETALHIRDLSIVRWGEAKAVEILRFSPRMLELQTKLEKAARYREPVLITGESGVGKELLAQAIYLVGADKGRPYVGVNCPQYQDGNLTVSELFGHTKGSFTGAVADRKGAWEEADGGVIFFDEVGDLHLTAQAMLLRALQTGEFKPLGAARPRLADVRVVAATNRSLNELVLARQFRYDLLFRLWNFHLVVPPLRERGEDWRVILEYTLLGLARKYGIAKRFSDESMRLLEMFDWPGNVRQLVSLVTIGYAMAESDTIEPDDFAGEMARPQDAIDGAFPAPAPLPRPEPAPPRFGDAAPRGPERAAAGELADVYDRLVVGRGDFWKHVYEPFMDRDFNREQVRSLVRRGLGDSGGNYRRLLDLLHLPANDYQRFMDFLRHHNLKP